MVCDLAATKRALSLKTCAAFKTPFHTCVFYRNSFVSERGAAEKTSIYPKRALLRASLSKQPQDGGVDIWMWIFFFFRGKRKKEKKKVGGGCWRRIERGFVPCMNFYSSTAANAVIFKLVFSLGGIHTGSARPGASHKAAGLTCNDLVCAAMHIHLLQNDIIIFGVAFRSCREKGARQDTDRQNLFRKYKIC